MMKVGFVLLFATLLLFPFTTSAQNRVLREIGEIKGELRQMNKRFDDMNRRFDDMNRRFDDMNKRLDKVERRLDRVEKEIDNLTGEVAEINGELRQISRAIQELSKRVDDLKDVMLAMFAGLVALVISIIGFAFWDRRTILRRAVEESRAQIEAEGRLRDVIRVLRELAKVDPKVEDAMRKVGLL